MSPDQLTALLRQLPELPEKQHDCPDNYRVASYMDGGLSQHDHGRFEEHMADCAYCIERVGVLGRAWGLETSTPVLKEAPGRPVQAPLWQKASRWAAAAVVVIAIGFVINLQSPQEPVALPGESGVASIGQQRYAEQLMPFPELLSPLENSVVDTQQLVFKWREVPDTLYYDIRIVSDEGVLITLQRVWETHWALPADIALQPDAEFFVRVDAYVSEGKALSSEHVIFKVGRSH